jgi:hypothetical protein
VDAPESFNTPLLRYGLVLRRTDLKDTCDTLVAVEAVSLFGIDGHDAEAGDKRPSDDEVAVCMSDVRCLSTSFKQSTRDSVSAEDSL